MFGSHRNSAKAYGNVGLETGISTASPHQLITILLEGALLAIVVAKQNMLAGNIAEKGAAISKAILFIDSGLRGGLNMKDGGDLAGTLDSLYGYMCQLLAQAHAKNEPTMLDEVYSLLFDIKSSWDAIGPYAQNNTTAQPGTTFHTV